MTDPITAYVQTAEQRYTTRTGLAPTGHAGDVELWCGWTRGQSGDLDGVPLPWRVIRLADGRLVASVMDQRDRRRLEGTGLAEVVAQVTAAHAADVAAATACAGPGWVPRT